ncbi:6002_t:CDS:2 [Funneliformis geosporum]|nr:6002_t:CDS:2 [Funneliformis geosporum]
MTTLQEQVEKDFPNKSVEYIHIGLSITQCHPINFTNYDLDLREFKKLTKLYCYNNNLTSLDVNGCINLTILCCQNNNLTSVDFLNKLPNPEKLKELRIYSNNIQPTNIEVFSKFTNFENRNYGEGICIEATDVNEGLEYLPSFLVKLTKYKARNDKIKGGYTLIECSPHDTNTKCVAIQNELRPFNYDVRA